jgi:uncharacterized protein YaaW (UPF0174 family)
MKIEHFTGNISVVKSLEAAYNSYLVTGPDTVYAFISSITLLEKNELLDLFNKLAVYWIQTEGNCEMSRWLAQVVVNCLEGHY